MIHIDFQGGAHGNYLEFICNKIAGVVEPGTLPFNALGASHNKSYNSSQIFFASHYSYTPDSRYPWRFNRIISIQVKTDDLLPLTQVSLLRAGDRGYDNNQLEIDTFNKLNNKDYAWMLDTLIGSFFTNQISDSYNAVKDPLWPDVHCLDDFYQLPEHIRSECIHQHGLKLLELSEKNPNCPRSVLREFFQIGFQIPSKHGFMSRQQNVRYSVDDDVYVFPFRSFYDIKEFLNEIKQIAEWAGMIYDCEDQIALIHREFLTRQPYKDSKHRCDDLVKKIIGNEPLGLLNVTMIEEAYINAALGRDYFQGD
jgi:hypothetical protein